MLVQDEMYFQAFCSLMEKVVSRATWETSVTVEALRNHHFLILSRKINRISAEAIKISPSTLRDYRYIYLRKKKFSVLENRLDLLAKFLGYNCWSEYRIQYFPGIEEKHPKTNFIRLLILPDKRLGNAANFEGQISELIATRYEELKEDLVIDDLEILCTEIVPSLSTGLRNIKEQGTAQQADLVIWPEYVHGSTPMIRVPFLVMDPNRFGIKDFKMKNKGYQSADELVLLHQGKFLEEVDIILFYMLGTEAYRQQDKMKGKQYFERILRLNPRHVVSLFHLGTIHQDLREGQRAICYYEQVLRWCNPEEDIFEKAAFNIVLLRLIEFGYEETIQENRSAQCQKIQEMILQVQKNAIEKRGRNFFQSPIKECRPRSVDYPGIGGVKNQLAV